MSPSVAALGMLVRIMLDYYPVEDISIYEFENLAKKSYFHRVTCWVVRAPKLGVTYKSRFFQSFWTDVILGVSGFVWLIVNS